MNAGFLKVCLVQTPSHWLQSSVKVKSAQAFYSTPFCPLHHSGSAVLHLSNCASFFFSFLSDMNIWESVCFWLYATLCSDITWGRGGEGWWGDGGRLDEESVCSLAEARRRPAHFRGKKPQNIPASERRLRLGPTTLPVCLSVHINWRHFTTLALRQLMCTISIIFDKVRLKQETGVLQGEINRH